MTATASIASTNEGQLLTVDETARLLRVSASTVRRLARRGELPVIRVGYQWRIDRDGLVVWAPVPATDGEDVEATARRYIEQGIEHRQSYLEQNARARAEPRSPSRLTGRELLNRVREDWGLDPLPE